MTTRRRPRPRLRNHSFDVPDGTQLVEGAGTYYLESGTDILGTVALPWATDADGDSLQTQYTWSGSTLTQHIDLSAPGTAFPVLADPAWGHAYQYNVGKTPSAVQTLLKKCFNCYFPVAGAPKAFPTVGTLLPLRVGPANFECKFASVFASGTTYFGYQFNATKNHIDGLGSNIIFEFRTVGGVNKPIVSAYVVNDAWWINNAQYRVGALTNRAVFALNQNA